MQNMAHQDTQALVIDNVNKIYTQWQRRGKLCDIISNLIHPPKKEVIALNKLSLTVEKGEFLAYAGSNGAGKSTTIKILSGILQPTSGYISVLGMNPAKERIALMKRIGVLFGQRTELWWDHPVITSFEWKKTVWNIPKEEYDRNLAVITELLDLSELLHTFARELSLGQRMRADLGMVLLHSPEVLFLDEPTLGLDVLAKQQMIRFLKTLNGENGTTIVVTSHDMDDLELMARRIILLTKGSIAFDGSFDTLRRQQGSLSNIRITRQGQAPIIPGLKFLNTVKDSHNYEFDRQKIAIHEVLGALAKHPGVLDIEIKQAPIEDIIAGLYQSWKQEELAQSHV